MSGEDDSPLIGPSEPPNVFMQWKGTTVCMDATCVCGETDHICGEMFAYALRCLACGRVYEMPSFLGLTPMAPERAEDFGIILEFGAPKMELDADFPERKETSEEN